MDNIASLLAKHEELLNSALHEDDEAIRADLHIKLALLKDEIDALAEAN